MGYLVSLLVKTHFDMLYIALTRKQSCKNPWFMVAYHYLNDFTSTSIQMNMEIAAHVKGT